MLNWCFGGVMTPPYIRLSNRTINTNLKDRVKFPAMGSLNKLFTLSYQFPLAFLLILGYDMLALRKKEC